MNGVTISWTSDSSRQCGGCQLCCKLLPFQMIGKPAGERCPMQRAGKGCILHGTKAKPACCQLWNCRWLVDEAGKTRRPDRAHYVIDIAPDLIQVEGVGMQTVVQIWIDPDYPDAHEDPALREWLAANNDVALVRLNERDGFLLVPPTRSDDGQWQILKSNLTILETEEWARRKREALT